jgi:flagellin
MRRSDRGLAGAMQRLSTGFRINSAKDDAAGLAISNKLSFQLGGLSRASENATHGISLVQTAEGALNEVHGMLQRMRELAVQAANDTNVAEDRAQIYREITQLADEIHAVANRTEFNRMQILNGEADRVTENYMRDAAGNRVLSRSVVSRLFIDGVNPGRLEYTIESVGTMAFLPITMMNSSDSMNAFAGMDFTVNGFTITVEQGESFGNFMARVNQELQYSGLTVSTNTAGTQTFLVSNIAGSDQQISVKGSETLLTAMGLTAGSVTSGTDARVTISGLYDILGNPVADINSLAVAARGNQISIRGTQGEDIRLNIQVNFDPNATPLPGFVFGNGMRDNAEPLNMILDIREFGPLRLQTGPNHNNAIDIHIPRLNAETLGLVEYVAGERRSMLLYTTSEGAQKAIVTLDRAIQTVSAVRARLGAFQNRLESAVDSLDVAAENTERSRSRIRDTDMARESTRFAQYNVMFQAAQAMLGQANQRPQQLLSLLQ